MATLSTRTNRLLVAGGFAVAIAAAPVVVALSTPAGPASHAVADCPDTEVADPVSGACQPAPVSGLAPAPAPVSDLAPATANPFIPEMSQSAPGSWDDGAATGNVGDIDSEVPNNVPCTGGDTNACVGDLTGEGAIFAPAMDPAMVPVK